MPFETIQSERIYIGRAFKVRRDQVRLPDGKSIQLDIVEHSGAVTIVPLDEQGRIWFVRQYRHATGQVLLELPAGTLEAGEPPELCAGREVREEIGMGAKELLKIGEFFLAPGYSTEYMHVYLARGLFPSPLPGDEDEFLTCEQLGISEVYASIHQFKDSKTLAALLLARSYLQA
jgi:ADP-ribose pyrophosphatase